MPRIRVQDQEKRLEREKRDKCKGSARVNLECLDFPSDGVGAIDEANVRRLVSVFKREGCFPGDSRYHVPAIIDHQQLQQAVQASGIPPEALLDQTHSERPELRFPPGFRLRCLHGRHRIQAGREMAPPLRWWTVDLYLAGVPFDSLIDDIIPCSLLQIYTMTSDSTSRNNFRTRGSHRPGRFTTRSANTN